VKGDFAYPKESGSIRRLTGGIVEKIETIWENGVGMEGGSCWKP